MNIASTPTQRFDQLMLLVNVLVTLRVVVRVSRAKRASQGEIPAYISRLLLLTSAFASLYVVSYLIIFTVGPDYRLAWSHIMITVSPFVWWIVWPSLADAVVALQANHVKVHEAIQPQIDTARVSTMELAKRVERVA